MGMRVDSVWNRVPDWKASILARLPEPVDPDLTEENHDYPPDEFCECHLGDGITFTRIFVLLAFLATAASLLRVGNPDTGIPHNYPVYVGFVYIVAVLLVLRRFHAIFDETKTELIEVFERTTEGAVVHEREFGVASEESPDVTADEMREEMNRIMNYAFHPYFIFLGGLIGGVFSLAVMWALDVFGSYPYLMLNYAYGAGHGFFYAPFLGSVVLIKRISNEYIVDIDVLDPDGVGGYRDIGDAIITLIIYGIFLVTLDFVILSSVSFIGRPVFQVAVFALYAGMLAFLLGLTVFGVYSLRKRLLTIRERKTDFMRQQYETVEARYWQKLRDDEPPDPESDHIQTMQTMFDQLHSMELWPINLASFARLAFSAGSSAAIAAYKAGLIPLPGPF